MGWPVGKFDGPGVGGRVGIEDGLGVGFAVGVLVVGIAVGAGDPAGVGTAVGAGVGDMGIVMTFLMRLLSESAMYIRPSLSTNMPELPDSDASIARPMSPL